MTDAGGVRTVGDTVFERECESLRPLGEAYVLRRFGGRLNHADAEDVVAEVLIRLHQRAARGQKPDNLRAVFFTSVRNAAIDQLRAHGSHSTVELEVARELAAEAEGPGDQAERREQAAVLSEALATMRRNYREALVLRFGMGLTVPEIAERRGITLNSAKKLVLRGTRQARDKLLEVTSASHCREMQSLAKRQLLDKYVAEVASEEEVAQLERHLEHCGRCKSLVVTLHQGLHELAGGLVLAGGVGDHVAEKAGLAHHISELFSATHDHAHVASEKARSIAFKATSAIGGGDPSAGGAFAGMGAKVAAVCGSAAAAACLATGVVGPGVPAISQGRGDEPPAHEQPTVSEPVSTTPSTVVGTTSDQSQAETVATTTPEKPVEPVTKEVYGGGTASSSSGSISGSRDFAAPVGSSTTSSGGGGGSSGSRENFGP